MDGWRHRDESFVTNYAATKIQLLHLKRATNIGHNGLKLKNFTSNKKKRHFFKQPLRYQRFSIPAAKELLAVA